MVSECLPVLGICGPIASGKDAVVGSVEEDFPVHIIDVDRVGHQLLRKGGRVYRAVVRTFGRDILDARGRVDRRRLGKRIFASAKQRHILDRLTHPEILRRVQGEIDRVQHRHARSVRRTARGVSKRSRPAPIAIVVHAALLHHIGLDRVVDVVWFVDAPQSLRIKRLMLQGLSREMATLRCRAQRSVVYPYRAHANLVLRNNATPRSLRLAARRHFKQLLRLFCPK